MNRRHPENSQENTFLDKLGIFFSALCCVHCIVTPILLVTAPIIGSVLKEQWIHWVMIGLVVPIAGYNFIRCKREHGNKMPLVYGSLGAAFLVIASLTHSSGHHVEIFSAEIALTILGSILLIIAHVVNIKICHCKHEDRL